MFKKALFFTFLMGSIAINACCGWFCKKNRSVRDVLEIYSPAAVPVPVLGEVPAGAGVGLSASGAASGRSDFAISTSSNLGLQLALQGELESYRNKKKSVRGEIFRLVQQSIDIGKSNPKDPRLKDIENRQYKLANQEHHLRAASAQTIQNIREESSK